MNHNKLLLISISKVLLLLKIILSSFYWMLEAILK